jgi:hypothetical protein
MGHHPLYSNGPRVHERRQLRESLGPTLGAHRVSAYLSGHQHFYERHAPRDGLVQIVSGGGGREPGENVPGDRPAVHATPNHYLVFERDPAGLHMKAVSSDGRELDHTELATAN